MTWLEFLQWVFLRFEELLAWFSSLDTTAQIFAGIGIFILACIAISIVYGIFQFVLEVIKFSLIFTVIVHYLIFLGFKLIIVALASPKEVERHWQYGVDNIKWILRRAYPKEYLKSETFIKRQRTIFYRDTPAKKQSAQVVVVKDDAHLHCTSCGQPFSGRMRQLAQSREHVFCDNCGQVFVLPKTA
jgi:hypothetical protein